MKFTDQELGESAFLTAEIEGNEVVYSMVLSSAMFAQISRRVAGPA